MYNDPSEWNGVEGGPDIDGIVPVLSDHGEAFEQNSEPHSENQAIFKKPLVFGQAISAVAVNEVVGEGAGCD